MAKRRKRNPITRVANPTRKHRRRKSRARNASPANPRRRRRRNPNPYRVRSRSRRRRRNPDGLDMTTILKIVGGAAGAVLLTWGARQIPALAKGPMSQYRGAIIPAAGVALAFILARYDRTAAHALAAASVALGGWDFADRAMGGKGLGAMQSTGATPLAKLIEAARARQMRVMRPQQQQRPMLAGYSVRPSRTSVAGLSGYETFRAAMRG